MLPTSQSSSWFGRPAESGSFPSLGLSPEMQHDPAGGVPQQYSGGFGLDYSSYSGFGASGFSQSIHEYRDAQGEENQLPPDEGGEPMQVEMAPRDEKRQTNADLRYQLRECRADNTRLEGQSVCTKTKTSGL